MYEYECLKKKSMKSIPTHKKNNLYIFFFFRFQYAQKGRHVITSYWYRKYHKYWT